MLDKEFQYYIKHETEFIQQYSNRFIMILNETVVGVYDTEEAAYYDMVEKNISGIGGRTSLFN
jgi:hypothetical protein